MNHGRSDPRTSLDVVQVRSFPPPWASKSLQAAVAHALSHPRLPETRRDSERLQGSRFVGAEWNWFEWLLRFDNEQTIHVWVERNEIRWMLKSTQPAGNGFEGIGAAPVELDWATTIGRQVMDRSALVAKRRRARFQNLFINDSGFFVYLDGHLILEFSRAERLSDGRSILYVIESE